MPFEPVISAAAGLAVAAILLLIAALAAWATAIVVAGIRDTLDEEVRS